MTTQPAVLSRQPVFTMEYQEHQSRLTSFFRLITVIPAAILVSLWGFAVFFTVIVAWFATLFTGRYPQGLYDFHAGFARYTTYTYGYMYLATDHWPGFSGSPDIGYPVQLHLGPPLEEYNRVKVLLRIFLAIPVMIIAYAMNVVAQIAAFVAWFAIVFTGKLPYGIHQMLHLGLSYVHRATPYYLLMTEDWPAFTQDEDAQAMVPRHESDAQLAAPEASVAPAATTSEGQSDGVSGLQGFDPPSTPSDSQG